MDPLKTAYLEGMQFTDADIEEFKKIWREQTGQDLTDDDASLRVNQLMELYCLLYQRSPEEESAG